MKKNIMMLFLVCVQTISCSSFQRPKYKVWVTPGLLGEEEKAECNVAYTGVTYPTLEACNASEELANAKEEIRKKSEKAESEKAAKEKQRISDIDFYVKENPKFKKFGKDAKKKSVTLGMPEELVYLAVGKPIRVNRSVGRYGVHLQLVYGGSYIYVRNGFVSSWQD